MNIVNIPAKISFSGELDCPMAVQCLFSEHLYNMFKDLADDTVYKDYQDISETSAVNVVNNALGERLLSNKLTMYTRITDAQLPATSYANALNNIKNFLGFNTILINRNNAITGLYASGNGIAFNTINNNLLQQLIGSISQYELSARSPWYRTNTGYTIESSIYADGTSPFHTSFIVYNPNDVVDTIWNATEVRFVKIRVSVVLRFDTLGGWKATRIIIRGGRIEQYVSNFRNEFLSNFNGSGDGTGTTINDTDNPYSDPGNSKPGGGDGDYEDPNEVDPTDVPDTPDIDSAATGLFTIYNPTSTQLRSLASFLWSGAFDPDSFKKLFADPMQCLIGLAIVPCIPASQGTKHIKFGNVDSEVSASYLASQFVKVDCGSVQIKKQIGSFLDYSPYTKISIFLPYIGFRELSADDLMPGSINVQYIVDVVTGACAAFIKHSVKGVLYSYNGSCITNLALTGANYSQAIQNAVSTVASGVGVVAGMASGNAPITAMSAMGLLGSACNTAINSKPSIQRSGNMGGSAGIMSVQKPYIIIERTNMSVPTDVQHYVGQTSNIMANLGELSGFTMVDYIHLHNVPATSEELKEIEDVLKKGVIL